MARRGENIRKRKDGRWEGRFLQEVNSVKSYHSVYAKSYSDVKQKLSAAKNQEHKKCNNNAVPKTIAEISPLWFAEIEVCRKSELFRNDFASLFKSTHKYSPL